MAETHRRHARLQAVPAAAAPASCRTSRRAGVDVLQLGTVADDVGAQRADVAAEIEWLVHGAGRQPGRRFQAGSLPTRARRQTHRPQRQRIVRRAPPQFQRQRHFLMKRLNRDHACSPQNEMMRNYPAAFVCFPSRESMCVRYNYDCPILLAESSKFRLCGQPIQSSRQRRRENQSGLTARKREYHPHDKDRSLARPGRSGLGLAFLALSGCQTWMAGMTLPSPPLFRASAPVYPTVAAFPTSARVGLAGSGRGRARGWRSAGGAVAAAAAASVNRSEPLQRKRSKRQLNRLLRCTASRLGRTFNSS